MRISRAKPDDAAILLDLLCSARVEIKLADRVCDEVHRDEYLSWMKKKCTDGRVLVATTASEIKGFLMFDGIQVVEYIVVCGTHRGKGIGEGLVRRFLSIVKDAYLTAEARNPASCRLLKRCGFVHEGEYAHSRKFPVLVWRRGIE